MRRVGFYAVFYQGDHIFHIHALMFHLFSGYRHIMLKDRQEEHGGDAGGEAAVIQHEAAVKGAGDRTHGSAHKTCGKSGPQAVAAYDRTKSGGKSRAVYVALRRDGPGQFAAIDVAEEHAGKIEKLVSYQNRPYVCRMLADTCEGESGQDHADGRSGKACLRGEEYGDIYIDQKDESMEACVDQANRHAVLCGEVAGISRIFDQGAEPFKAFSVQKVSCQDTEQEKHSKEQVAVKPVGMAEAGVNSVSYSQGSRRYGTCSLIHQIVDKETEKAEGQSAVVQVVALMPGSGSGKDSRDHIAQHNAESDSHGHAGLSQVDMAENKAVPLGIAE